MNSPKKGAAREGNLPPFLRQQGEDHIGLGVGTRVRLGVIVALVLACPLLMFVLSHFPNQLFPLHRQLTKAIAGALAALTSFVSFTLWDWMIPAFVVLAILILLLILRTDRPLLPVLSWLLLVPALTLFLFVGWACNHYAPPLATDLELEVREYSVDELAQATKYYLEESARVAAEVPRDEEGQLLLQDFYELANIAGGSYENLAETYPVFKGSSAPVKALLLWGEPLLYSGHTGIYWAPTGESGVPLNCAIAETPFIMCHEAAHRLGLAGEDEANFVSVLACIDNSDARFAYSGNFCAFSYCYSALYREDPERARQVMTDALASDVGKDVLLVAEDYNATNEHYAAYNGTFEEVGRTVNDTYLRTFGEEEGVHSYGLVVDYLIAWTQR